MPRKIKDSKRQLVEFLTEHFFDAETKALNAVKLGIVYLNGKLVKRPGIEIDEDIDQIKVVGGGNIFVSRGGYKLQKALQLYDINLQDRICLDIGASTGGFTDCMLQSGASKVFAIDTGYGQIDWKLRTDPRVNLVERMNVRYLLPERLYANVESVNKATFAAIDVSFISAIKVIPNVQGLLMGPDKSELVILIKPQFEAGKNQVARGGLIKNPKIHLEILSEFVSSCYRAGLEIKKITHSPILGASGNLEFVAYATWPKAGPKINLQLNDWLSKIIDLAYTELGLKS
ncbi:MAG: TlyA family RNA methyltransferase [Candidatus Caenarcaniphilales bacterium]|nr:TlyA family RNA methyltransferase [Candidatus Caenarcaniphilales bacterium]